MRNRLIPTALLGACLALTAACNSGSDGPPPTPQNIWPHADGSTWTYDLVTAILEDEPTRDAWPADLPSMSALRALLEQPPAGTVAEADSGLYTITLDGLVTTETGITAQHLVESYEPLAPGKAAGPLVPHGQRLLALAALVRPELRDGAGSGKAAEPFGQVGVPGPMLLGGYAFAFEDSGYYSYGDVDTHHSWTYLETPLLPGTAFSQRLLAGLAGDLWLHGRIWSVRDRSFGGVRYRNVLECMYLVDLGLQALTDESGTPLGEFRSFVYGRVFYAPEVGPVAVQERAELYVRTAYEAQGTPVRWASEAVLLEAALPHGD